MAKELAALGYEVTDHLGKYENPRWTGYGVVGVLRNGSGPTVLVRTELDALPVEEKTGLPYASKVKTKNDAGEEVSVMHACGHDIHITSLLGTAKMLAQLKGQWHGTLLLVAQPAEETVDGAKAMLADGLYSRFPKPDYAVAQHDSSNLEAGKVGWAPDMPWPAPLPSTLRSAAWAGTGRRPKRPRTPWWPPLNSSSPCKPS